MSGWRARLRRWREAAAERLPPWWNRALAGLVIALTGSRSAITRRPLPVDDPVQRCPDVTQAKTHLAWQPTTDLKAGLARTIAYFDRLLSEPGGAGSIVPIAA